MPDSGLKLCVDCRWCRETPTMPLETLLYWGVWFSVPPLCTAKQATTTDIVTGRLTHNLCSTMRDGGGCGPEGRLWEIKGTA